MARHDAHAWHGPRQPLLEQARAAPWRFGFLGLLRRLAAAPDAGPGIGRAARPRQERFRLGQAAELAFAPREIAEVLLPTSAGEALPGPAGLAGNQPGLPLIRLLGLGLLGPNGPLPLHYTEWVRERGKNHHDGTLANFLDIFHHRHLSQMYRAWAQSQSAAGLDRADEDTFSPYIARLCGHDPLDLRDSPLAPHARLSAAAHLSQGSRHADGLVQTLRHFFAVPVQLQEFVMHWIRIEPADLCCLGAARPSSNLGGGAVAGAWMPDRQGRFRLMLGPLSIARYLRFTPRGADLPLLVAWVQAFIGHEFAWELELRVRAEEALGARLDAQARLGWSTWLGDVARAASPAAGLAGDTGPHATGMVFEPQACSAGPPARSTTATATATAMADAIDALS